MSEGPTHVQNIKHNDYYHNRFNSQHYLDAYAQNGEFPHIHKKMGEMISAYANEPEPAVEFGGCIGMMAAQAISLGRSNVLCFEGNEDHVRRAVKLPEIEYVPAYIFDDTIPMMEERVAETGATLLIARRVLSEVGIKDPEVVTRAAEALWRAGVKKCVIQGRVPHPSPTVPLWNTELECKAMCDGGRFQVTRKDGAVWMLERIG